MFESKFMLPWSLSEEAAANRRPHRRAGPARHISGDSAFSQEYMPQLQHNMWVVAARSAGGLVDGGGLHGGNFVLAQRSADRHSSIRSIS